MSKVHLIAPTPPPTSDALFYASALAFDADADDASDERGLPLPTSDVRRLPRARPAASDECGLSPRADVDALASALASDADTDNASDGLGFFHGGITRDIEYFLDKQFRFLEGADQIPTN